MTALVLVLLSQVVDPPALDEAERQRQGKVLLAEGLKRYSAGEYEAAVGAFKAAYALAPAPGLLFNLAQSYRLWGKGHCLDATRSYRAYLQIDPTASNRDKVEAHLKNLEACTREEQAASGADASAPSPRPLELEPTPAGPIVDVAAPPAEAPPPRAPRWPPLLVALAGAGGLGLGVGLYAWAGQDFAAFQRQCPDGRCPPELWAGARGREQAGIASMCLGAAALVASAIWWVVLLGDSR